MRTKKTDRVDPKEVAPVFDELQKAIVDISKGMAAINNSRLKRETIVTLIHAKSGVSKTNIELVLNNLDQLEATWLKKIN